MVLAEQGGQEGRPGCRMGIGSREDEWFVPARMKGTQCSRPANWWLACHHAGRLGA